MILSKETLANALSLAQYVVQFNDAMLHIIKAVRSTGLEVADDSALPVIDEPSMEELQSTRRELVVYAEFHYPELFEMKQ